MDLNSTPFRGPKARVSLFSRAPQPEKAPKPPNEPRKRPRRPGLSSLSAVLSFMLVAAVVGVGAFVFVLAAERRAGPLAQDKVVLLTREDDDGPLADQLERGGVIENSAVFAVMTMLDGQRSALKRGEYFFHAGISMREVEELLLRHRVVRYKMTVPEGLTSEQIVERLRDPRPYVKVVDEQRRYSEDIVKTLLETDPLSGAIKDVPREGSLFPDTYPFERGEARSALVARMIAEQTKTVNEIWPKRAADLPIKSPGELVTLASIVEKETGKSEERPRVAGVFVNRLQKHMRLQSDPTIVYGIAFGKGTLGRPISKADIAEATPYNTYAIDGLPPGPICNPGRAAMEAVANPQRTRDLFFAADGTGGHAFSETYDQHQKNVVRLRQIEKDSKDRVSPDVAPPNVRGEADEEEAARYAERTAGPAPRVDTRSFGALGFAPTVTAASPAVAALAARLAKIADSRRKVAALMGAGGSLSAERLGGGKIDEIIVTGVNDPPPGAEDFAYEPQATGGVVSSPLSPAALADLRARAARYGDGQSVTSGDVAAYAPAPPPPAAAAAPLVRARAFDASEGTKLDPLRNKTWDLSSAKTVPAAIR